MRAFDLSRYTALTPLGVSPLTQSFSAVCGGQRVLLKQLKPALAAEESTRRAWVERARLASQVRHPSLLEVLDCGEVDGAAYLAAAWVEGCSLRKALDLRPAEARKLEPGDVVSVARAVLTALDVLANAHTSLLHLNITPNNLLLTPEGSVMLTEPGLWQAIPTQEAARLWFDSGKVGYQSPEQVEARGGLDARSDLFSLGCVLYELLTGTRPFTGKTQLMVAMAISRGERLPLAQARPSLPENLVAIVEALCAQAPDARFGSAQAALRALETCDESPCLLPELISVARAAARQDQAKPKSRWQTGQSSDGNTVVMDVPKFEAGAVASAPRTEGPTSPFVWAHRPEDNPLPRSAPASSPSLHDAPTSRGEAQELAQPVPPPMVSTFGSRAEPPASTFGSRAEPPASNGPAASPFASARGPNAAYPQPLPHHAPSVGLPSPVPPPMLPALVGSRAESPALVGSRAEVPALVGSRSEPPALALLNLPAPPPVAPPPAFPAYTASEAPPVYPAAAPPVAPSGGPASSFSSRAEPPASTFGSRAEPPASTPYFAQVPGAHSASPPLAPLPAPLAPSSFTAAAPSPLADEAPSASIRPTGSKRWQEPSKTLFQVKVRNLAPTPGAQRTRLPLALKLALAGMVAFGLVLGAALLIRALR